MSVAANPGEVTFVGNASTSTPYAIPFRYDATSWLRVESITADGTVTSLALGSGFTAAGDGSAGIGTILTVAPVPSTSTLHVYRETPQSQLSNLIYNGLFSSANIEKALDWLTMEVQDTSRRTEDLSDRALKFPNGETATTLPAKSGRTGRYFKFNATTGQPEMMTAAQILGESGGAPAGVGVPIGGIPGQTLGKTGAGDYDLFWQPTAYNRPWFYGSGLAFRSFRLLCENLMDASWVFAGDSVTRYSGSFSKRFADFCAATYPNHRVEQWKAENDMSGTTRTVVQAGPLGRRNQYFPTGTLYGLLMHETDSLTTIDGTTNLSFEVEVSPETGALNGSGWPAVTAQFMGYGAGGNRGVLEINTSGIIRMNWTVSGGASADGHNAPSAIPAMVVGTPVRYRADITASNGSNRVASFYYSTNEGVTWTQIGATDSTQPITTFGVQAVNYYWLAGFGGAVATGYRYYYAQILVGVNRESILPRRIDLWRISGQTANVAQIAGSPTIYIDIVAKDGATMATGGFFTGSDSDDFPVAAYRVLYDHAPTGITICHGHNDVTLGEAALDGYRDTAVTNFLARFPVKPAILFATQNPEPADYASGGLPRAANTLQLSTIRYCARKNYDCVDFYSALIAANNPAYSVSNNVHPSDLGYDFMAITYNSSSRVGAITA